MAPPAWAAALLLNPWFRTLIAGSGFFADSYDLFITDGVGNILKNLGPTVTVNYTYATQAGTQTKIVYFNSLCDNTIANDFGRKCMPVQWSYADNAWVPRTDTTYQEQMQPRYQTQTAALKNEINNAALIGSILGQVGFGFMGDIFGRKGSFVITSLLIILGTLGSATSSAGQTVANCAPLQLGDWTAFGSNHCEPSSSMNDVYIQLAIWRGIMGFGVGGEYPLASTIGSEAATTAGRGRAVLSIFSMQGWGKLTASIVNYGVIATSTYFGGPWQLDAAWRFSLAFGCVFNLLTIYFRWHMHESAIYKNMRKHELELKHEQQAPHHHKAPAGSQPSTPALTDAPAAAPTPAADAQPPEGGKEGAIMAAAPVEPAADGAAAPHAEQRHLHLPHLHMPHLHVPHVHTPEPLSIGISLKALWEFRYTLIGTASTWFLIDVTFYGQSLMNTTVVNGAVANTAGQSLMVALRNSLAGTIFIMLIALPGYWFAIAFIDKVGRYNLTQMGFFASAVCFAVLCGYNGTDGLGPPGQAAVAGFTIVYGLTYFFANFGPNSTTFLMPSEAFPTRIRSTAHGISAACGKLGATAGSYGLLDLYNSYCVSTLDQNGNRLCTNKSPQWQTAHGVIAVMGVCVGVSLAGNIMTTLFVRRDIGKASLQEVDASSKVLKKFDDDNAAKAAAAVAAADAAADPEAPPAAAAGGSALGSVPASPAHKAAESEAAAVAAPATVTASA